MTPRSDHLMPDELPADLFQPVSAAHHVPNDYPEPGLAAPTRPWSKQIVGVAGATLGLVGVTVAYALIAHPSGRAGVTDRSSAPQPAAATALPAPPPPLPAPADTADALIDPPGQTRSGGGMFDLATLKTNNLLPPAIQDALQAGQMTDGALKTTTVGDDTPHPRSLDADCC